MDVSLVSSSLDDSMNSQQNKYLTNDQNGQGLSRGRRISIFQQIYGMTRSASRNNFRRQYSSNDMDSSIASSASSHDDNIDLQLTSDSAKRKNDFHFGGLDNSLRGRNDQRNNFVRQRSGGLDGSLRGRSHRRNAFRRSSSNRGLTLDITSPRNDEEAQQLSPIPESVKRPKTPGSTTQSTIKDDISRRAIRRVFDDNDGQILEEARALSSPSSDSDNDNSPDKDMARIVYIGDTAV
mmetsp:Transcript_23970/g.31192  ORF Transcript_23970/g.31192 Transcript_23970/m.31192 type:complete len:237 (-) Transcript_23970:144-854(-)